MPLTIQGCSSPSNNVKHAILTSYNKIVVRGTVECHPLELAAA